MSIEESKLRSQGWFGKSGKDGFIYRAWMKKQGIPTYELEGKPIIGICNTWSELTPCNSHFRELAESVKRGILEAGGFPVEFPVMSLGETLMKPTAMLYRNQVSIDVEESIRANPLDGVVLLCGCDKTTPALVMGACSVNIPSIVVSGGPMLTGKHRGSNIGTSDIWRFSEDIPIPGIVGLNPSKTNAGKIENKGWELGTNWRSNIDEFQYSIGAGIASVEDRLTDYAGLGITPINQMYHRWEGSPVYAIRGYKVIGIYQTDAEAQESANIPGWADQIGAGDYQYEDVNGDGVIDWDNDAQLLGDRTPKYTFNLNLGANWKGIDMSTLWNGAAEVQTDGYYARDVWTVKY